MEDTLLVVLKIYDTEAIDGKRAPGQLKPGF